MREGALSAPWVRLRDPATPVLVAFAVAIATGFAWGLPGSHSWAADSISPRSCGLGAIVETYLPGHFHAYPPLHMALLTVLSLPWVAVAASRVGTGRDALAEELVKPLYMTGIEVSARLVAALMGLAIVWNTMRLWTRIAGRRAGVGAGVVVATNATLVYYAHTGNLDVPYIFWTTWALVEMDRVVCGEAREQQAILLSVAAALTKDQAVAALLLPVPLSLALLPWAARGESVVRRSMAQSTALALVVYGLVSGAIVNPAGFRLRMAFLFGPASQTWAAYPPGVRGAAALAYDALRAVTHFTSWSVAFAAALGLAIAITSMRGVDRIRALLPAVAAVSFALFFTFGARRSEDRFLLPQSVLLLPYAALAFDRAWSVWIRARGAVALAAAASLTPALLGVASIDATLLADPRYAAERFLAALPPGARVEVYGGPIFLPRVPAAVVAVRPGVEPIADRQRIVGVAELVDPAMDPRQRDPDAIVLATELSSVEATEPPRPHPFGLMSYRDAVSHALFRSLLDGSLGYVRALRATCSVSWPLECRAVHHSTAGEAWIYVRRPK